MASRKRQHSEEFVQVKFEEPSSTTVNFMDNINSEGSFGFKYFNQEKMNKLLLSSTSFIKAIRLVEDLIDNPNLNVYYSHVAIPRLRSVNVFDKHESLNYSDEIRTFLRGLVHDLNYDTAYLPNAYCHFIGDHSAVATSNDDYIQYDTATINGIISLENSNKTTSSTISKQVFFIFVKTLHELGHASIYRSARSTPEPDPHSPRSKSWFTTPATHALSGEAGNAIERFLFGSVIDTIGKEEKKNKTKQNGTYIIKHVILQEKKPSGIIEPSCLTSFINLDLKNLEKIPKIISKPLSNKKLKSLKTTSKYMKKSSKCMKTRINDEHENNDENNDNDEGEDENEDEDDDEDDDDDDDDEDEDENDGNEPLLASNN